MLEARKAVRELKPYQSPRCGAGGLCLDLNENTGGCSPRVLTRLAELSTLDVARYPQRENGEALVAEFLGVRPEQTLLTNGVDEGLQLLCQTYLEEPAEALFVAPTFTMYEVYAAATGARVVMVTADAETDFAFPVEQLLAAISPHTRLIAIANPNNPTGAVVAEEDLLRVIRAAPQAAVIVDEAYYEFYGRTLLGRVGEFENLFVTRTFSKAYGLAGLRVGAIVGEEKQMAMLRRLAAPFNVNAAALAVLPEAIADKEFVAQYLAGVCEGRERVRAEFEALGYKVFPSQGNFVLARIGENSRAFVNAMRGRGILVRDRSDDAGCEGCVRITMGTRGQNEQLVRAVRDVCGELPSTAVRP